ncbi:fimbrial biogenesis outer membrane usher protein [Aeromonas veronii]|uniref:fimbria/pilus outer membrane usher protein n=1 Tax=Aeromonas veronii TaxID=654 RepID=UPI00214D744B|nr:fimbria/pilus outer membrane usher protein [Aeromonas veronii]MCR3970914.1 fimbrial biogenesis outer membrane usher protein [Aeromonas veronii]MCR3975242.1 fimbrial biogenesis outer membrane usher protein [Aeromonas veronii]
MQKYVNAFSLVAMSSMLYHPVSACAEEVLNATTDHSANQVAFDPIFLSPGAKTKVDIKQFEKGGYVPPGNYHTEVFVNDLNIGFHKFLIEKTEDDSMAFCMKADAFRDMSLNYKHLSAKAVKEITDVAEGCLDVKKVIPDIIVDFDSGRQVLNLTIPQAYLLHSDSHHVSPEFWDEGIPALKLGYQGNYYTMSSMGRRYDSAFVGLNAGLNVGAWQLRHNGNFSWTQDSGGKYNKANTFIQRDIPSIGGRIIAGESNTRGDIFDSLSYRGVELRDVEQMLPQSERGFAPEVRGIARTNAKVTVSQNGLVIRETTVTPGPFYIDDLYPNGYGGDLDVTVTEADGSIQQFSVPYASTNQMLRPGAHNYDVVIGEFRDFGSNNQHPLYELTYKRGLTNTFTGYGGVQSSNADYYSMLLGTAVSLPIGALAFDVSQSQTSFSRENSLGKHLSGQSYRFSYSKILTETNSSLTLAAYRYSTAGYLDFSSAMQMMDEVNNGRDPQNIYRPKNRFSLGLSQGLPGNLGQLHLTGYTQNYWDNDAGSDIQYQLGYNNSINSVSWGVNAGRVRNGSGDMETTFMLNVSMPLTMADHSYTPNLSASLSRDGSGNHTEQIGISGTAGKEHQYTYGATVASSGNGSNTSATLSGMHRSSYSNLSASVGKGNGYSSASMGANGTLIAWSDGAVLTPYNSDTFAVVEAEGASGASVGNYNGVKVDSFGHAAVPYLNPYEINEIHLDPKGARKGVELENSRQRVAPLAGAVVKLNYATKVGYPLLVDLKQSDIEIPFGSEVTDAQGNNVGFVGQGGKFYAQAKEENGMLFVQWGAGAKERCGVKYSLPSKTLKNYELAMISANCVPLS